MKEIGITLYEILGISQHASLQEIKMAYRQKAIFYHPDANPGINNEFCHKMIQKINEAYRILRNPDLRILYDETLCEKGRYDIPSEDNNSSTISKETSRNEAQTKTDRKSHKPSLERYNYYNVIDFDADMQKEFIEWIESFSYEYICLAFDYYRKHKSVHNSVLEEMYDSFDDIVNYEKELLKKKGKSYSLNI